MNKKSRIRFLQDQLLIINTRFSALINQKTRLEEYLTDNSTDPNNPAYRNSKEQARWHELIKTELQRVQKETERVETKFHKVINDELKIRNKMK